MTGRSHSLVGVSLLCLLSLAVVALPDTIVVRMKSDDEIPLVAAWSPDGQRLAYGTEKRVERSRSPLSVHEGPAISYPGQVWVTELEGKPKRIVKHDFLRSRDGDPLSFSVERLAWSPDGEKLLVELTDERKNVATFLFTDGGKEVKLGSRRTNFVSGYGAGWLGDSQSLGLLNEALSPQLLHRVSLVRVAAGRTIPLFGKRTFAAVAWLPEANKAVLVERDRQFAQPPRLSVGDLETGEVKPLDDLNDGYLGGLQASPSETHVSYFVEQEKLAVRGLDPDAPVEYWPVPFGPYQWARPRQAVLFIEPQELGKRTGWLTRYDRQQDRTQRVLPQELIQDFWVSPDGQRVAVLTAGLRPTLKVYPLVPASPAEEAAQPKR